jgi:hypothetical protein
MSRTILVIVIIVVLVLGFMWFTRLGNSELDPVVVPSDDVAELVAFQFVQDFVAIAPPNINQQAEERAYQALSNSASENISRENLSRDLAGFMGVQDVPDQGVSVEDLQRPTADRAVLIVGLDYSGSRVLRGINMIVEDGEWKVDSVEIIEEIDVEVGEEETE